MQLACCYGIQISTIFHNFHQKPNCHKFFFLVINLDFFGLHFAKIFEEGTGGPAGLFSSFEE